MTTKAGRPINPNSILQVEGGTKIIRIGKESHDRLLRIAGGDSIIETVSRLTKQELSGKQGKMLENEVPATKGDISRLDKTYLSLIEKIEQGLKYLADREPEQVALFKILAYGEDKKTAYTPEMLKADISEAVTKVIEKMAEKQVKPNGESQPV